MTGAGVQSSTGVGAFASGSRSLALAALLLLVLVAWLAGVATLPPLDRDESRFAQASHQMVESGDYVDIRFAAGHRYNKPIGIYWLQAGAAKLVGPAAAGCIWPYRLPSILGGLVSLLFVYGAARGFLSPRGALLASGLLGATLLLTAESEIATTDAVLLACTVAAEAALMAVYRASRVPTVASPTLLRVLMGWIAVGLGVLLKGPVILAVLGVTAMAVSLWDRQWRWLARTRPLTGIAVVAAMVAPWAVAIGLESHGAFYQQSLGHDFAAKVLGGQESHGAPPGYYLLLSSLTLWPATLFLLPALVHGLRHRSDPVTRFLLAWAGASWLMFELTPTKLPHYVLPAYPALALLVGIWAEDPAALAESPNWARGLASIQFAFVAAVFAAACFVLPGYFGGALEWPGMLGVAIAASAAALALLHRDVMRSAVWGMASALVIYVVLAAAVVPQLHDLWLSPKAATLVTGATRSGDPPVVLAGYVEPSLVFLLGGRARIETGEGAADIAGRSGGLALVEDRTNGQFLAELSKLGAYADPTGQAAGFDYSSGRRVHLTLYRVVAAPRKLARASTP